MSNLYETQPVRKKHGLSWEEEYILGLVANAKSVKVSAVLGISNEVMTQATTHKYLTQLLDKEYVKHDVVEDRRVKPVKLTAKGQKFIKELADVNKLQSMAMS